MLKDKMKISSPDDYTFPWSRFGSTLDYARQITAHCLFRNHKTAERIITESENFAAILYPPFFPQNPLFLFLFTTISGFCTSIGWKDWKDLILTRPTIFSIPSRSRLFCSSISTAFQRMVSGASLILCTSEARWIRGSFQERSTPSTKFSRSSCWSSTWRKVS